MTSTPPAGAATFIGGTAADLRPWWADAVIYQIYPRSFADGNGDGMGDLPGIRSRLPYLAKLGVNAVWLSPFYVSPQADAGYDVADYREVDPRFGTLDDFDAMLGEAHALDLRVIVDLVPNHTSDEHEWFQAALAAGQHSVERERYMFRDGSGVDGSLPPNNWQSIFGGNAWTRVEDGQWYLHLFDTKQPDLNWENPEVREEMISVLRFWLDRGVDGFRIDVAHGLVKAEGLPDWSERASMVEGREHSGDGADAAADSGLETEPTAPYFDQPGVHAIYREWNGVLAEYEGNRMLVAEAWVEPAERLFHYVREDEMQQAFNFGFLLAGWDAGRLQASIEESLFEAGKVGAPSTWVLSNHDTVRHTSRFGLGDPTTFPKGISADDEQPDEALGLARGKAATLVMLALPGSAYLYQGDELGLPEHTTLPHSVREDPAFFRTGGVERGRDGCRVPLPWSASAPGFGFGDYPESSGPDEGGIRPWLPQPDVFAAYAADQQVDVGGSTFELYRAALELRREHRLGSGSIEFSERNDSARGVLSFRNGTVLVVANLGTAPVQLPAGSSVLAASAPDAVSIGTGVLAPDAGLASGAVPGPDAVLAPNASVWLRAVQQDAS
ncbi:glycoside hydrolase family 13 protein [Arthrobacter sp. Br18]|uniref:glycoside hydrolase family 13 protein n=1 Tax=Arthrobacter sp. Br18 TaxID=1312954 RepID=UPI0004BBE33C|nr:glycoside hydrolase family 13 protein [Arthrobacter sp. Br18]